MLLVKPLAVQLLGRLLGHLLGVLACGLLLAPAGCTRQAAPTGPAGSTPSAVAPAPAAAAPPASAPAASAPPVAGALAPSSACKADADCVAVADDCCGCTAGGRQTVVARAKLDDFEAARAKRCAEASCIMMMSSHPSCRLKPVCVSGGCRLVP